MGDASMNERKTFLDKSGVHHIANFYCTRTACHLDTTNNPTISYMVRIDGRIDGNVPVTCIECLGIEALVLAGYVYDHGRGIWVP